MALRIQRISGEELTLGSEQICELVERPGFLSVKALKQCLIRAFVPLFFPVSFRFSFPVLQLRISCLFGLFLLDRVSLFRCNAQVL
jgi:hypothetical protein